jgi:hypothetical protein
MKNARFFGRLFFVGVIVTAFVPLSRADASAQTAAPSTLQIRIDVPPTWRPFLEDDVAVGLFSRISDTFKRRGFKGDMVQLDRMDQAKAGLPVLQINLMEWRISRIGNVDCTFSATFQNGGKSENLGLFNGTSMLWISTPNHRWQIEQGLDDSAQSAIKDLYAKLRDKKLL